MIYDAVVVGAGAMGSAAARALSRDGLRILLVEQFQLGHARGASHGDSRIYRWTDSDPHVAGMAQAAWSHWKRLEEELGKKPLLKTVASVDFGRAKGEAMKRIIGAAELNGIEHTLLTGEELCERFPAMRPFSDDQAVVGCWEAHGSIVDAASTLAGLQQLFLASEGCAIAEHTRLVAVERGRAGGPLELKLAATADATSASSSLSSTRTVRCEKLVLAPGPYANAALAALVSRSALPAFKVWRMTYGYFRVDPPLAPAFALGALPVWRSFLRRTYGFPINEREGFVKIAAHGVSGPQDVLDAPSGDEHLPSGQKPNLEYLDGLAEVARGRFHGLGGHYEVAPTCYYTMAPDEQFVLGLLPEREGATSNGSSGPDERVVVATGFAGSGFKHVPLVGAMVRDFVVDGKCSAYDAQPFDPSRFRRREAAGTPYCSTTTGINFSSDDS